MTTTVTSILQRAVDLLQDAGNVRWTASELVRWFNDAENEVLIHRPDAFAHRATVALVAGVTQALPAEYSRLIEITNNAVGKKTPVRLVDRRLLDDTNPAWRSGRASTAISHYTYDPRVPREFNVEPPALAGAAVELVAVKLPTPIAAPAPGAEHTAITGDASVADQYRGAVVDFILYRGFSKDADYAQNAARAAAHYTAFANALGIELRSGTVAAPSEGAPGDVE
jgi:hypothetical protein